MESEETETSMVGATLAVALASDCKLWLRLWVRLEQLVFNSPASGGTAGGHAQFAVDRAHMRIDSQQAQDELFSNLGAGQALREQAQHL